MRSPKRTCPTPELVPFSTFIRHLFAAEGSIQDRQARRVGQSGQPAGAAVDRPPTNMFGGAGLLFFPYKRAGYGIQPIVGLELADLFRRPDTKRAMRLATATGANRMLAARERGLSPPDGAELATFWRRDPPVAAHKLEWLEGYSEDVIARPAPDGPYHLARMAIIRTCCRAVRPAGGCSAIASCRIARHGVDRERRVESGLIDLPMPGATLRTRPTSLFRQQDDSSARRAVCIAGGRSDRRNDREQLHARITGSRPGPKWRCCSPIFRRRWRTHRRDRRNACAFPADDAQQPICGFTVGAGSADVRLRRRPSCAGRRGRPGPNRSEGARPSHLVHRGGLQRAAGIEIDCHPPLGGSIRVLPEASPTSSKGAKNCKGFPSGGPRSARVRWSGLCLDHHRPRSIRFGHGRGFPQSRTRLNAGLHIDFRPDRRGEVIDYVQSATAAIQCEDHHLANHARAGRAARSRPCAADALWAVRQNHKNTGGRPEIAWGVGGGGGGGPSPSRWPQADLPSEAEAYRRPRRGLRCGGAFDIAQRLEGLKRHASNHSAGIVIGDPP